MKTLSVFAAAALASGALFAEDEKPEANADGEKAQPAEAEDGAKKVAVNKGDFSLLTLPFCRLVEGVSELRTPGASNWKNAENGKYYPLGTSFRVRDGGKIVVMFADDATATISGNASFTVRPEPLGAKTRTLILNAGELLVSLPRNTPLGMFSVSAGSFQTKDLSGESKYDRRDCGDGDETVIRCVTGSLALEGRHFSIPAMRVADELKIRASHDNLCTFLYGTSGDYVVKIDRGLAPKTEVDAEGAVKEVAEQSTLDWHLSPATKVRIDRRMPAIGERMSVSVMTFDTTGALKNNFAFSEGRAEVNTGELVPVAVDESAEADPKKDAEKAVKKSGSEDESSEDAATGKKDVSEDGDGEKADAKSDAKENKDKEEE